MGETLTATVNDDDGVSANVTYQWLANGVAIAGATGSSYQLTANDAGKTITVRATYTDNANHSEAPTSAATTPVVDPANPNPQPPQPQPNHEGTVTISGEAKVGETLTATVKDDDGFDSASVKFQWLRDGQKISGAEGASYKLAADDVGHKISVQATYDDNAKNHESPKSTETDAVTDNTTPPNPQPNHDGAVSITGEAKVGETLSATVKDDDGFDSAKVKYQWLRDGTPINHATQDRYTLTKDDLGHKISVKATYEDNGKHAESPTSSETNAVVDNTPPPPPQPNEPGITLTGSQEVTEGGKATYTVSLDHRALPQANSAAELLHNLQSHKGILFGQQRGLDVAFSPENSEGHHSDVHALSGHYPGMIGLDMMEPPRQRNLSAEENGRRMGEAMRKIDSIGGIPTLSAHWNMPGGETDRTKIDLKRLLPGGDQNAELNGWLDAIVETGKHAVRDDGTKIPFLFRPLHEANGDWMWWNYERSGAETYKELFRYVVHYLKEHGLDGQMLTTFAPNGGFGGDESRYKLLYPGDDVVDVLGMDFYDTDNTRLAKDKWAGELVQDLAMLSRMAAARGKIAALAEFGREGYKMLKPDGNTDPNWYTDVLEAIKADPDASKIAFMHTWANFGGNPVFSAFTPWPGHEMAGNFNEFVRQLTMTRNADRDVTVDVTIQHGTTDDGDVKTTTHTVTIPKGQNSATFTVDAVADGKQEGDEHYTVRISKAQGGQIEAGKDSVTTTIHDEGSAPPANHAGTVTITGEAKEDTSLTATVADDDGVPNNVAYQWLRDGTAIDGAHGKTYVLRGDDVGHKISVQARYTDNAAHDEAPTSSETAEVERKPAAPPPANHPGIVNIRGEAKIGSELSAEVRDGNGYDANSVQYQWLRDGQPIAGATHGNYTLQAEDAGHKISVRAAYTDGDKYPETPTSSETDAVVAKQAQPQQNHAGTVSINGTLKVGETLTAAVADEDGVPKDVQYQWLRDGQPISGGTGERYQLTADDAGHKISVQAFYQDKAQHAENADSSAADATVDGQSGYRLVWQDEFDGTALNDGNWQIATGGWNSSKVQNYYSNSGKNVSVSDGTLKLSAHYEPGLERGGKTYDFTSGFVESRDKQTWTYGYFEARIKMPTNNGSLWPAFWMSPNKNIHGANPRSGEIDVMEAKTHDKTFVAADTHWGTGSGRGEHSHSQGKTTVDDIGQWHTYSVKWQEGKLEYYVDGQHHHTVDNFSAPNATTHPGPFNVPFYLRLNMAVGGTYLDPEHQDAHVAKDKFPATMEVDYVRVYQLDGKDGNGASPQQPPAENHEGSVAITGEAKVGATLAATVSDADGVPTSGVKYQWYADGKAIDGATAQTFTLTTAQKDAKITVQATYDDNAKHHETPTSSETPAVSENTPPATSDITANLSGAHDVTEGSAAQYHVGLDLSPVGKTASAAALLQQLKDLAAHKQTLFGQQHAIDESARGDSANDGYGRKSDVAAMSGKYPAVFGFDSDEEPAEHGKTPEENGKALAKAFIEADSLGATVTLSSHLKNPVTGGSAFDISKVEAQRLISGDLQSKLHDWLDTVATAANNAVRADGSKVPVIFRPLHENTGDWFWWGKGHMSADDYKALWQHIHKYLEDKGVDNLLYAYSPNGSLGGDKAKYLEAYPGDNYVDIFGYDAYQSEPQARQSDAEWRTQTVRDLEMVTKLAGEHGKVAAFTEFGLNNERVIQQSGNENTQFFSELLDAIKGSDAASQLAYMMTWANWGVDEDGKFQSYTPWPGHEMEGDFKKFLGDLTLAKMPEKDVTVDVTIAHGTTDDGDAKLSTERVTIAKGQSGADFTVEALADGKKEGDETYTVKITHADGANIGKENLATTIHDGSANSAPLEHHEPQLQHDDGAAATADRAAHDANHAIAHAQDDNSTAHLHIGDGIDPATYAKFVSLDNAELLQYLGEHSRELLAATQHQGAHEQHGGSGDDTLVATHGTTLQEGGAAADTFAYLLDSGDTLHWQGASTITDYNPGEGDHIVLKHGAGWQVESVDFDPATQNLTIKATHGEQTYSNTVHIHAHDGHHFNTEEILNAVTIL
ncbi:glycosyl hydrolase [Cardiobacterium hominis]|uniref:glycosyl hydrolase n=1 Tax=Cardiobacterium hominis TaxID=2718 RepID=UPI0028D7F867|nr:glycosyl hydrolase [Cardiobacterium hominis]